MGRSRGKTRSSGWLKGVRGDLLKGKGRPVWGGVYICIGVVGIGEGEGGRRLNVRFSDTQEQEQKRTKDLLLIVVPRGERGVEEAAGLFRM